MWSIDPYAPATSESPAEALERYVSIIRRIGIDRVVLSSDGGGTERPPHIDLLESGLRRYASAGVTFDELDVLVRQNPRRLVPLDR
jgi:hypothetical protein